MKINFTKKILMVLIAMSMVMLTMAFASSNNETKKYLTHHNDAVNGSIEKVGQIGKASALQPPPGFLINPRTLAIPACTAVTIPFQCINTTGALPTVGGVWRYIWTVGPGWNWAPGEYTTYTDTIYLTSTVSTTSLSVSVRAIDYGAGQYSGGVAVVAKAPFVSNAVINGNNVCSGPSIFNIAGVNATETVVWSVSDPSLATLSNSSSTQTTVTMAGAGNSGNLIATITNSCNQSVQKIFPLYSGIPTFDGFTCNSFEGHDFCSGSVSVPYTYLPSLSHSDKVTANFIGMTAAERNNSANWEWQTINNKISISKTLNLARIGMLSFGQTGVRVRAKNACGWTDWQELNFEIIEIQEPLNRSQNSLIYTVFPNPTSEMINVVLRDKNIQSEGRIKGSAQLYNMKGQLKSNADIINNTASINVKSLEKGIYLLKINSNGHLENHRIVID